MIGGAELEPGSQFFNPDKFDVETLHAAANEREELAAGHEVSSGIGLQSIAILRNQTRRDNLAKVGCRTHDTGWGAGPMPADCPNCKRAQTKAMRANPEAYAPTVTAEQIGEEQSRLANHYRTSAKVLRRHAQMRNAASN